MWFELVVIVVILIALFVMHKGAEKRDKELLDKIIASPSEDQKVAEIAEELSRLKDNLISLKKDFTIRADAELKSFSALAKAIKETPSKTLNTIQGSINNTTGKMGEMIQFLELQQIYDRLIIAGDIVDFIGIKFPTEDDPGSIDFLDIKTGKKAALSTDQRKLRDMIQDDSQRITFKAIKTTVT